MTGVTSHDISLEKQEVLVKATIPYDDVLAKIKKTGKEVKGGKIEPGEIDIDRVRDANQHEAKSVSDSSRPSSRVQRSG